MMPSLFINPAANTTVMMSLSTAKRTESPAAGSNSLVSQSILFLVHRKSSCCEEQCQATARSTARTVPVPAKDHNLLRRRAVGGVSTEQRLDRSGESRYEDEQDAAARQARHVDRLEVLVVVVREELHRPLRPRPAALGTPDIAQGQLQVSRRPLKEGHGAGVTGLVVQPEIVQCLVQYDDSGEGVGLRRTQRDEVLVLAPSPTQRQLVSPGADTAGHVAAEVETAQLVELCSAARRFGHRLPWPSRVLNVG
eukprot:SAG11_NODE_3899_length_2158_cov_2.615347_2_plen_252_part_00